MSEPEQGDPPAKKGFGFNIPKMSLPQLPKIPNLPGLIGKPKEDFGDKSLHECIMPPTNLQNIPDIDVNTQNYYDSKIKPALDTDVIQPYKNLGGDLPHILAAGFRQYFVNNDRYKEYICNCIGSSVERSMGYVIETNSKSFQNLLQKGGSTCNGDPPFDFSNFIKGIPSYALNKSGESKNTPTDPANISKQLVADSLSKEMADRFAKKNGATLLEINNHIDYLLYLIYHIYNKQFPHTSIIRKLIDTNINKEVSSAILDYIKDVKTSNGDTMKGGEGEGEGEGAEAPAKKPGFFSGLKDRAKQAAENAKKKLSDAKQAVSDKASALQTGAIDAAKAIKRDPLGAMSSFAKSAFSIKPSPGCEGKNDTVADYKPSTYQMHKLIQQSDNYAGTQINAVLCQHKDTLKQLCSEIVQFHLYDYLKEVPENGPLFNSTKNAYIYCIAKFCEQLPEDVAFKMIYKYMFTTEYNVFSTDLLKPEFEFDTLVEKNEPFSIVNFIFKSDKNVTDVVSPTVKPYNQTPDSPELKYLFDPEKLNGELNIPLFETITSFIESQAKFSLTYGGTKALPRIVFTHLKEVTYNSIINQDVIEKIFKIFDETIYRSVDAVNNQFKTDIQNANMITVMCKYLISKHSITSKVIDSAMKAYNDMYKVVITRKKDTNLDELNKLKGFYVYHTLRHMMDRNLIHTDFEKLYEDYATTILKIPARDDKNMIWKSHPLRWVFSESLTNFHTALLGLVGKPFSYKWVSEYPTFKLGGSKTRRLKRPKHSILKKRRKTRRPRKPVGRRFSRKLSNKKNYTR